MFALERNTTDTENPVVLLGHPPEIGLAGSKGQESPFPVHVRCEAGVKRQGVDEETRHRCSPHALPPNGPVPIAFPVGFLGLRRCLRDLSPSLRIITLKRFLARIVCELWTVDVSLAIAGPDPSLAN